MPHRRVVRFSTASVEGARTSLWISAIDAFANSDLSRVADVLLNEWHASTRRAEGLLGSDQLRCMAMVKGVTDRCQADSWRRALMTGPGRTPIHSDALTRAYGFR